MALCPSRPASLLLITVCVDPRFDLLSFHAALPCTPTLPPPQSPASWRRGIRSPPATPPSAVSSGTPPHSQTTPPLCGCGRRCCSGRQAGTCPGWGQASFLCVSEAPPMPGWSQKNMGQSIFKKHRSVYSKKNMGRCIQKKHWSMNSKSMDQ